MRTKLICAAAALMLVAAPAFAQQKNMPKYGEVDKDKTRSEIEEEKANERAYKRAIGNIPAKADVDPWGSARAVEKPAPKADTKSSAMKSAAPAKPKPAPTAN